MKKKNIRQSQDHTRKEQHWCSRAAPLCSAICNKNIPIKFWVRLWFFFFFFHQYEYQQPYDSFSSRELELPGHLFLFFLLCWLTTDMQRHPKRLGVHPAFRMHACAHQWVCAAVVPALSAQPHTHTHKHIYRRVVNISWAVVYFTAFLCWMWSPLT